MKKFLICFIALITVFCSCAIADDGFYVISYKTFMEAFVNKVNLIHHDLATKIWEECYIDNAWTDTKYDIFIFNPRLDIGFSEGNGFLDRFSLDIATQNIAEGEVVFKKLMLAAATSIIADADEEFERTFFDNIYYDYAMSSPAGYITMYWNCGVYLFTLTRSSTGITFDISLSVYEANK